MEFNQQSLSPATNSYYDEELDRRRTDCIYFHKKKVLKQDAVLMLYIIQWSYSSRSEKNRVIFIFINLCVHCDTFSYFSTFHRHRTGQHLPVIVGLLARSGRGRVRGRYLNTDVSSGE